MKVIYLTLLLILFGAAEVAATATLVDSIGVANLVMLYVVTTAIGATFLAWQYPLMRKFLRIVFKKSKSDQLEKDLASGNDTPEVSIYRSYLYISVAYTLAWILILIPGLVTDLAAFVVLVAWFRRRQLVLEAINA